MTSLLILQVAVTFLLVFALANLLARVSELEKRIAVTPVPRAPVVGKSIPELLRTAASGAGGSVEFWFLSSGCPVCERAIAEIERLPRAERERILLTFPSKVPSGFVLPAGTKLIQDAAPAFKDLEIVSPPHVVAVTEGIVTSTRAFMDRGPAQKSGAQPPSQFAR